MIWYKNTNYIIIGILLFVALIAVTFSFIQKETVDYSQDQLSTEVQQSPIVCTDALCFIKVANSCTPSIYTTQISGVTIRQTVSNNCTLVRTVTDVVANEPSVVQKLKGLSSTCSFVRGNFNPRYTDLIIGVPSQCEGPLTNQTSELIKFARTQKHKV